MSARALLMVQTERGIVQRRSYPYDPRNVLLSLYALHLRAVAPRAWWLVEAESADAARQVITMYGDTALSAINATGRILASGGAR